MPVVKLSENYYDAVSYITNMELMSTKPRFWSRKGFLEYLIREFFKEEMKRKPIIRKDIKDFGLTEG